MQLFNQEPTKFPLPDADIEYFPQYYQKAKADSLFEQLKNGIPWKQDDIRVFGKVYPQPRLTALFGDGGKSYSYSGITMNPHPWNEVLASIKNEVEAICQTNFTTVLLNYYRDGRDSNGWHADDEKELGRNPVIASLSLGAERFFHLRHNYDKAATFKILLEHGSLLLMKGETQHFWKHQIPKTAKPIGGRINLTFRTVR